MATSDFSVRLQAGHPRVGIEGAADKGQRVARPLVGAAPVDAEAAPAAGRREPPGEADVLGDRHPFDEAEVLVDEGHGRAAPAPHLVAIGRAVDEDLAAIGPEQAAQHLDERRLAGAVLAQQRHDLAPPHVEADALERPCGAERLHDVVEPEVTFCHAIPPPQTASAALDR